MILKQEKAIKLKNLREGVVFEMSTAARANAAGDTIERTILVGPSKP